jgi:hypothetical protein
MVPIKAELEGNADIRVTPVLGSAQRTREAEPRVGSDAQDHAVAVGRVANQNAALSRPRRVVRPCSNDLRQLRLADRFDEPPGFAAGVGAGRGAVKFMLAIQCLRPAARFFILAGEGSKRGT